MDNISDRNITGIHHITAISASAQENLDFYSGILGMRLIKKTVNFDDPGVYHLYFADYKGTPGGVLTFFPYEGVQKGRKGAGMVNTISFSVPSDSLSYWESRLDRHGIYRKEVQTRLGDERYLYFEDNDGLGLELVFNDNDNREGWKGGTVPEEFTIRGFFGATIWHNGGEETVSLLTGAMDHKLTISDGKRKRYAAKDEPGAYLDLVTVNDLDHGAGGSGTVHHIAFRTADTKNQDIVREKVSELDLYATRVIDRQYFKSVYFREPGGVLFEIATDGPGFTVDEDLDSLGTSLMLPPQYEDRRSEIEQLLPGISIS